MRVPFRRATFLHVPARRYEQPAVVKTRWFGRPAVAKTRWLGRPAVAKTLWLGREVFVHLIADRFVADDDNRAIDLASGGEVAVKICTAGSIVEQRRWTIRCDQLHALHHRAIAELADFGAAGETTRFEAWRCSAKPARGQETQSTRESAVRFFRAAGLTVDATRAAGHATPTRIVSLPSDGTGYPDVSAVPDERVSIDDVGLRIASRPLIGVLGEMFTCGETRRPRAAVLWGPPGSGRTRAAMDLARIARRHGFVPVAAPLLLGRYASLFEGRSLFVIGAATWSGAFNVWLRTTITSSRAHVFVMVSDDERGGVESIRMPPLGVDALVASVYPPLADPRQQRRIRLAAEGARGLPGRFARLLFRRADYAIRESATVVLRAAEHAAVYGSAHSAAPAAVTVAGWPSDGESGLLRRRMDAALRELAAGRVAAGTRQLRQVVGAFARRGHFVDASSGALALASSLLARGRPRHAQGALNEARDYADRANRSDVLVDIAIASGEAWIDLARLDEAEAVLTTASITARDMQDRVRMASVGYALARCLYWRGQYGDAAAALQAGEPSPAERPRHELLAARIALAQGDTSRAMAIVSSASSEDPLAGEPGSTPSAPYCRALVRMNVGDLDGAERDLSDLLSTRRTASNRVLRVRARLLWAEIQRRRGRIRLAAIQVDRLARAASTLPPLVRARWALLKQLLDPTRDGSGRVAGASRSDLVALTLYVGAGSHQPAGQSPDHALVAEVVAIVRACQSAEDESLVLKDVCARLRQRVHGTAVWFMAGAPGRFTGIEGDGPRMDAHVAERAVTAGIALAPHRLEDRIEAAVPVQYGGATVAALCARWTIGCTYDLTRVLPFLEMAAAAAAPLLSVVVRRREQRPASANRDLLGVTSVMDDLRRTVERAAAAPFCVLIEGESGSGKELVARAIHRLSPRRDRPFGTLNCAALPDDLVETELFGHARGAFTGATGERTGVFEEAHGGTLFLDEVGELSPRAQAKVLRVIQEGELRRVGENVSRRVDVRLVAATNRDLRKEAEAGRFRLDLLYRLDVVRLTVPPLRDRRDDIALLAEHVWTEATGRLGSRATLSTATVAALARYDWPGNVRELQNVLAALAVRSPKRGVVPPSALPPHLVQRSGAEVESATLTDARRTFDERFIRAALVRTGGHRGRAAAELGVTRQGLTKLIARLGIAAD